MTVEDALLKSGIKPRVPLKRAAAAERRPFTDAMHFDSESANSFPPRLELMGCMRGWCMCVLGGPCMQ